MIPIRLNLRSMAATTTTSRITNQIGSASFLYRHDQRKQHWIIYRQRSLSCSTESFNQCNNWIISRNSGTYNRNKMQFFHKAKIYLRQKPLRLFASNSDNNNSDSDNVETDESNKNSSSSSSLVELDFFGEPVTFIGLVHHRNDQDESLAKTNKKKRSTATTNAMAALDGFLLATVTKGLSCSHGGDEGGLEARSQHSAAISWSELLRFAAVWNQPIPTTDSDSNTGTCSSDDIEHSTTNDEGDDGTNIDDNMNEQSISNQLLSPNNQQHKSAPMLSVVAVAPLLIHAGIAYVKHIDKLLKYTKPPVPGLPVIQMYEMATVAASHRDNVQLNLREQLHLQALHFLLSDQYPTALAIYCKLLRTCPGDALALSLTMDLCHVLGDKKAALIAAGSVASYWDERRGGIFTPSIPGQAIAGALMAVGLAVGNKVDEAEMFADRAMTIGKKTCGALATWAQCHVYDAKGRVAEGISALANFDGTQNYEGSGVLFFESRLGGYGARFALDREERGRGKSAALRLYEAHFERIFEYSGFNQGKAYPRPVQRAPIAWRETNTLAIEDGTGTSNTNSVMSVLEWMFGHPDQHEKQKQEQGTDDKNKNVDFELIVQQVNHPSTNYDKWEPSAEDVLTWLPPTPPLLADATLLCLRFTLNGTISNRNARWDNIRNAWNAMMTIIQQQQQQQEEEDNNEHDNNDTAKAGNNKRQPRRTLLTYSPLVCIVASLLIPPEQTGGNLIGNGRLAAGLYRFGELLQLGNPITEEQKNTAIREYVADRNPNFWLPSKENNQQKEWKNVVQNISSAIDGIDYYYSPSNNYNNQHSDITNDNNDDDETIISEQHIIYADPNKLRFQCWDFEARPIFEHAIVYAACKAGDTESLSYARSICSAGVTIRLNSPEEWWRYSIVLGLLGDRIGSEDALYQSINLGGGQGATGTYSKQSPPKFSR